MKKQILPVFFVHSGNNDYLNYTIKQAENVNSCVYLLGDESNKEKAKQWFRMSDYLSDEYNNFTQHYVHMSSNPYLFELNCFRRFFVTYEFAKRNSINRFMMLDSDLLAFSDFSKIDFGDAIAALSIPHCQDKYVWTASPHCSYWTIEGIRDFLNFLTYEYTIGIHELMEKWEYHQTNQIKGGICDMTLLYLWARNKGDTHIYNTLAIKDNAVFDHFLSVSEGIQKGIFPVRKFCNIKHLKFVNGEAFFKNNTGEWIKTHSIHAQGKSKIYIPTLYAQRTSVVWYVCAKLNDYKKRLLKKVKKK